MSDFFQRLAGRALGIAPVVQPIVPSIFAPDGGLARWEAQPELAVRDHAPPIETGIPSWTADVRHVTLPEPIESFRPERPRRVDAWPARADIASLTDSELARETIPAVVADRPAAGPAIGDEPSSTGVAIATVRAQTASTPTLDAIPPREGRLEPATAPPAAPRREAAPAPVVTPVRERPLVTPMSPRRERAQFESQPPVVRVTIGRIDVRANFPAPVSDDAAARKARPAARSLDDYLKERIEGKR
jgi:hypothetical protein